MEEMMLRLLPVRRLSRAEYHYRWENYLCLGCDGELTSTHKCPRKILVWIENEDDCDEELTLESEGSSKAEAKVAVPEEQNLLDEMPKSMNKVCMAVNVDNKAELIERKNETMNLSHDDVEDECNLRMKNEKQKTFVHKLQLEIVGYVNSRDLGDTLKVFDEMLETDLWLNSTCFDILIDSLLKKSGGGNKLSKPFPKQIQENIANALHMDQRIRAFYLMPKSSFRDQTFRLWNFIPILQFCARTLGWKVMKNNFRWSNTSYFLTNQAPYGWKPPNVPLYQYNATLVHAKNKMLIDIDEFFSMVKVISTTMQLAKIILIFDPGGGVHSKFHLEDKVVHKEGRVIRPNT